MRQFEEMFSHIGQLSARGETKLPIEVEDDDVVTALRAKAGAIRSRLEHDVTNAGLDWQLLKSAYANNVAAMDPNWAHSVADTIYSFHDHSQQELQQLLLGVNTFNELLHLTHSYVMNDDSLRDSLEVWSDSSPGHRIRGLGTKNKATEEIHQAFLTAWGLGNEYEKEGWRQRPPHTVDIVLAGSTLHIIVRDRGHALSLVVNNLTRYQEGEVLVQYNIPKVLNKDMVRQLPGISTVKPGYASGQWTCHISDLANKIMSFVKQVPTDFDNPEIQAILAQRKML